MAVETPPPQAIENPSEEEHPFLQRFTHQGTVKHFKKGQILFLHQDPADAFYIILSGWVKLFRETMDGQQVVVDILSQNHSFGEMALFENNSYPYSAEVIEEAELLRLPLDLLEAELKADHKLTLAMLEMMATQRKAQDEEIEHRTIQNAPQRIGCFLLRLIDQSQKGAVTLHLPYDKTLVASRLGMQPETFSRALSKLKTQTGIIVSGAKIEIADVQSLSDFACGACTGSYPCGRSKAECIAASK